MAVDPPVSVLLSQLLVAFTIEFDNEFEHHMPHRTARGPAAGSRRGPWLVSMAMWANFMRYIDEEGTAVRNVEGMARLINLAGLQRWGYVVVEPDPAGGQPDPARSDWVIRPTLAGRKAQAVWRPLPADQSLLSAGLRPYPDGWRAHPPYLAQTKAMLSDPAAALPHYPMVLHRGGFPDGS